MNFEEEYFPSYLDCFLWHLS